MSHIVICKDCGNVGKLVDGSVIYPHRQDLQHLYFYKCSSGSCDSYVGCHPDSSRPLGTMANAALRKERSRVHRSFDPIWKTSLLKRKEAYAMLAKKMGIDQEDCHIAHFDMLACEKALKCVREFFANDLNVN